MTDTPETLSTGDTQAHIDAMVAKADAQQQQQQATTDERPAWLPEKFKSPEDMAKAYAELEKKQGGQQETPEGAPEGDAEATQTEADQAAQAAVEGAGLDMDALGQKIAENGSLDDSDYEALAKQGITRQMVDTYVAGQQALGERLVADMQAEVGGEETFNSILEWAAEELPANEVKAFNDTVDSGSPETIKLALQGLHAKYVAAGQKNPTLVGGKKTTATGDVFRSTAELTRAMNDPRYARDPAYRQDVIEKLNRSSVL